MAKNFVLNEYKILIDCATKEKRDKLNHVIKTGGATFHWRNNKWPYEKLSAALQDGTLELQSNMLKLCHKREIQTIRHLNLSLTSEHGTKQHVHT